MAEADVSSGQLGALTYIAIVAICLVGPYFAAILINALMDAVSPALLLAVAILIALGVLRRRQIYILLLRHVSPPKKVEVDMSAAAELAGEAM